MRSRILASTLTLCAVASSALAARPQPDLRLRGFAAGLDGRPVIATSPVDGREWAAWTYRNGTESDIAIATRVAGGAWSDPAFLGRHDRLDEVEPALAVDAAGHLYLAFAARQSGRVYLTALPARARGWVPILAISPEGSRAGSPSLRVVGDRLVLAFRSGRSVELIDFALLGAPAGTQGIQDGPDGIDPLGQTPPPDPGLPPPDSPDE
jgi:hypothetical protein